jgi:hypothetical protein
MKSSDILKEVLYKFEHNYDSRMPGLCNNLVAVISKLHLDSRFRYREICMQCQSYFTKYEPENHGLYWWTEDAVDIRINVLNMAIVDAIEAGD